MSSGADYKLCRTFAANGSCPWQSCKFSHSLIDTARIIALVGDVSNASFASATTLASSDSVEQTFFVLEYTKYSLELTTDSEMALWRMRLLGGGRATVNSEGGTMSVQPQYPLKGQGKESGGALIALEGRVFGCIATVRLSLCLYAFPGSDFVDSVNELILLSAL